MSRHPVDHAIETAPCFGPGVRVLAAVSGGADSMALLAALASAGVRVVAAHFDHRIRPDSARDIETVRTFADVHGIRVVTGMGDVPARARETRVSMETAAREARYEFLRDAAARASSDWIATAHTRSDQVETVLMRILRGAGPRGLAGIAREHGRVVRPLLDVSRADTLDYCARHGIVFVTDPSNEDRRHARNAIRHDTLPALRLAFPGIDAALLQSARLAEEMLRAARSVTDARLARLSRENGAWVLPVDAFAGLDETAAAVLIGDAMEKMTVMEGVTAAHYAAVLALTRADRVGTSADLPGVHVRRDHDALVWRVRGGIVPKAQTEAVLRVPGSATVNGWTVTAEAGSEASSLPPGQLTVRAPRPGDRIRPVGMSGRKKLSDVFIDKKVPHRERARVVVIESDGEIVWVPGVVAAESTRVPGSPADRVHLTASREGEPA